jgi:diguanylate cyclase (GGDEF)-like protein/PAS domain S-box-containing protein
MKNWLFEPEDQILAQQYKAVADIRFKETGTRICFALMAMLILTWFGAWKIGLVWLFCVAVTQIADGHVNRRYRTIGPISPPTHREQLASMATAFLASLAYSSQTLILWLYGGAGGQAFAMTWLCGALLHVTFHMHHQRRLLLFASLAHGTYIIMLPVWEIFFGTTMGPVGGSLMLLAGLLYLAHIRSGYSRLSAASRAMVVARDVEKQRRAAAEAAKQEAEEARNRFEAFSNVASDWLWEIDTNSRVVFTAGRFLDKIGQSPAFFLNETHLRGVKFRETERQRLMACEQSRVPFERVIGHYITETGEDFVLEFSGRPEFDKNGEFSGFLGIGTDITDRVRAESEVKYLAENDKLTGLSNRHAFNAKLEEACAVSDAKFAVFLLDLDDFKGVNDAYGHDIGDALLCEVGRRLRRTTRGLGDLAARLGGDEFTLVCEIGDGDNATITALAERLMEALTQPFMHNELRLPIAASIGVARFPADAATPLQLMKSADLALYAAKKEGRNCWQRFDPSLEHAMNQRKSIERELRQALAEGTLSVSYQPQVEIGKSELIGFEALARWCNDEGQQIPPDVFVPIAEECGLMPELGVFVLRAACHEAAQWPSLPGKPAPRISVNISALQFAAGNLLASVEEALRDSGLAAERLELEITESALMIDTKGTVQVLNKLNALGVSIAIDDFGTGYSSLSYLKAFPLRRLKVDRSFVADLTRDASDYSITNAIVQLAKSLGLQVIAEGVETEDQLAVLAELGCNEAQGYLFSRPIPAGELSVYFATELARAVRARLPKPARRKSA